MKQEEKDLLLKDLCARLPYGIKVNVFDKSLDLNYPDVLTINCAVLSKDEEERFESEDGDWIVYMSDIKPYLRSMSSMTEEECELYDEAMGKDNEALIQNNGDFPRLNFVPLHALNFLLSRHFDICRLIPMGLALEAPKDMYKI